MVPAAEARTNDTLPEGPPSGPWGNTCQKSSILNQWRGLVDEGLAEVFAGMAPCVQTMLPCH